MKQISYIRWLFQRGQAAGHDRHFLDMLDILQLPKEDSKPEQVSPESKDYKALVAAILRNPGSKGNPDNGRVVDNMLYVFFLENNEPTTRRLIAKKALYSNGTNKATDFEGCSTALLQNEVWRLQHDSNVQCANWNRSPDSSSRIYRLLVTITRKMLAYVWRIDLVSGSFEVSARIDVSENVLCESVMCRWIEIGSGSIDSIFSGKEYVLFYSVLGSKTESSEVPDPKAPVIPDANDQSSDKIPNNQSQYYEIYSLDGIYSLNGETSYEYILGSKEIPFPLAIRSISSVAFCKHTFETGLLSVYAPDSIRPNKISAKLSFNVSKWVTLRSMSVCEEDSNEYNDEMLGTKIAQGLNMVMFPCVFDVVDEHGFHINIFLTPCDLFLKDRSKEKKTEIVGIVVRYLMHVQTPFYLSNCKYTGPASDVNHVDMENAIIDRLRVDSNVSDVKYFKEPNENIIIVLYTTGEMVAISSCRHNSTLVKCYPIKIENAVFVCAFDIAICNNTVHLIIFYRDGELYKCGFCLWHQRKLCNINTWVFRACMGKKPILHFSQWYEDGPFFLITPCSLLPQDPVDSHSGAHIKAPDEGVSVPTSDSPQNEGTDVIKLYVLHEKTIVEWLELGKDYVYDSLLDEQRSIPPLIKYTEDGFKMGGEAINCKVYESSLIIYTCGDDIPLKIPLFASMDSSIAYGGSLLHPTNSGSISCKAGPSDKFSNDFDDSSYGKMYGTLPVYHPSCLTALMCLGLRKVAEELICVLVETIRNFFTKILEDDSCGSKNGIYCGCDCMMFRILYFKLFNEMDRSFFAYFLKVFVSLNNLETLKFDEVYSEDSFAFRDQQTLPLNELIVYLEVFRLPRLTWDEQNLLLDIMKNIKPRMDVNTDADFDPPSVGRDTASNFFAHTKNSQDLTDLADKVLPDLCQLSICTTSDNKSAFRGEGNTRYLCALTRRASYILDKGRKRTCSTFSAVNYPIIDMVTPLKLVQDEFCLNTFLQYVKSGREDDNQIVWAILCCDDVSTLQNIMLFIKDPDDLVVTNRLLKCLKRLGLGFWINSADCLERLCTTIEKGFRRFIAVTDSGTSVEKFDNFGFWSIIRNKSLLYGHVLKAKGFAKMGEFFSNDFSEERWRQAAIKNAFVLIGQKRYLLSAALFVMAKKIEDAVDVCFQYLDDPQLASLICKIQKHDISYVLSKMHQTRVKDLLLYKMGEKKLSLEKPHDMDSLVYTLYLGFKFQLATEEELFAIIRKFSASCYQDGMPFVSLMLHCLIPQSFISTWDNYFTHVCKLDFERTYSDKSIIRDFWGHCIGILSDFCSVDIDGSVVETSKYCSGMSILDLYTVECKTSFSSSYFRRTVSDVSNVELSLNFAKNSECDNMIQLSALHLYVIDLLLQIKKKLGINLKCPFANSETSFDTLDPFSKIHGGCFTELAKRCIGIFEEDISIDGKEYLSLIIQAIVEIKDNLFSLDTPFCIILSVSCVFAVASFDRGIVGQIYEGFLGQVMILNAFLNGEVDDDLSNNFLIQLLQTIEPLMFGSQSKLFNEQTVNILGSFDVANANKHRYFGLCITFSLLETVLGIGRNWIYKLNAADNWKMVWIDRLCVALSKFFYKMTQLECLETAISSSGISYSMLTLRTGLDSSVDCKINDQEYHVYDSFLEGYVASVYGSEFEKLWRFLRCSFRTFSIFHRRLYPNSTLSQTSETTIPSARSVSELSNCEVKSSACDHESSRLVPLVIPLYLMFSNPTIWSEEYVAAQMVQPDAKAKSDEKIHMGECAVLDALRNVRFVASHNLRGIALTTFYSMPNATIYSDFSSPTAKAILGPVSSDLYLMALLNSSGRLSNLSKGFSQAIVREIYAIICGYKRACNKNNIYVRLVRLLAAYCRVHVENLFGLRKESMVSRLSERFFKKLHTMRSHGSKEQTTTGGPSGGICGHPKWPIYAIVYGESPREQVPAYSLTLQHSVVLINSYKDLRNHISLWYDCDDVIYDNIMGTRINVGQGTVFGDLCSISWSGDSLAVFDKNGWFLVYNMKERLYLEDDIDNHIAIPSIFFRTHSIATSMCWLGECHVATVGNGAISKCIHPGVLVVDGKIVDNNSSVKKLQKSLTRNFSGVSDHNEEVADIDDVFESVGRVGSDFAYSTKSFYESNLPCVCIWDLIDYDNNNVPKLKVIIKNSLRSQHSLFNKRKHQSSGVKFTCILPISFNSTQRQRNFEQLENDIMIFDSCGMARLYSATANNITLTFQMHNCSIIKCFSLENSNIVTVAQDGVACVWKLNGLYEHPTKIFEAVVCTPSESEDHKSGNGNIVSSIGEYLGIKLVDQVQTSSSTKDKIATNQTQVFPEIADVQIINGNFLVTTTMNGTVTVTKLQI